MKITIGYIAHNQKVFNRYLKPSLEHLVGDFNTIFTTSVLIPAKNYNDMIDRSDTSYLLFVHEDVTFSPDFLENIQKTIQAHPDFGALGVVGTDAAGAYHWSEINKIKEQVEQFDCCCILINKEHGIRFDEIMFDDFHLYVEDYCMSAKRLGLKCYTIPISAYEGKDTELGYEKIPSYFRHHSYTVRQRGFCWGRYHEYLNRLKTKWL